MSRPNRVAHALFALLAFVIVLTFRDYGISWDEELQNTYGVKLLAFYTSGLSDMGAFDYGNLFLYGGFFDIVAAILNSFSPFEIYETRHFLGGMVFLAGLLGGWKLARLLAGERAGLIALVFLATTPLLYGHGFINPKDSPLSWLGIWSTYYACRMLMATERPAWSDITGFGVSLGLTIGTRVIGIVYLFYFLGLLAVAFGVRAARGEEIRQNILAWLPRLGASVAIAYVVMGVFWPWAAQEPLNIFSAFSSFTHFPFYPPVLWDGALVRADGLPPAYLLQLLLMQLPEYILVGLVFGAFFAARRIRHTLDFLAAPVTQQYLLVTGTALAPLVGFELLHPTAYNGLRHFLFVIPPLVILAAIGLNYVWCLAEEKSRVLGMTIAGLLVVATLRQSALMVALHPYEYVSYNSLIGGLKGAANRFELEYWGTSLAESAHAFGAYLKEHPFPGTARVFACGDATSIRSDLPSGSELVFHPAEADFYIGMTAVPCFGHDKPGPIVVEVKRMGVAIGYVRDLRTGQTP